MLAMSLVICNNGLTKVRRKYESSYLLTILNRSFIPLGQKSVYSLSLKETSQQGLVNLKNLPPSLVNFSDSQISHDQL